jgi:hypothetical protein
MAEENVGRVLRVLVFCIILCCHRRAQTQQWQDDNFFFRLQFHGCKVTIKRAKNQMFI